MNEKTKQKKKKEKKTKKKRKEKKKEENIVQAALAKSRRGEFFSFTHSIGRPLEPQLLKILVPG